VAGKNPRSPSLLQLKAFEDGKIYIIFSCFVFGVNFCLMDLANCVVGIECNCLTDLLQVVLP
jgi:hypothetical protein